MTTALHANLVAGALDANASTSDTTLSSPQFAELPAVASGSQHLFISLFRRSTTTGAYTRREIVKVVDHAALSTTVTVQRGQEGTGATTWVAGDFWTHALVASEADMIGTGGGGGAPALLAVTQYNPATQVVVSRSSSTFADLDPVNLTITFVAPPSGKVLVTMTAYAAAGTNTTVNWNLRNGGADVASSAQAVTATNNEGKYCYQYLLTGLTPGASYTYTWGSARGVGSNFSETRYGGVGGASAGAAVMSAMAL